MFETRSYKIKYVLTPLNPSWMEFKFEAVQHCNGKSNEMHFSKDENENDDCIFVLCALFHSLSAVINFAEYSNTEGFI